MYKLTDQTLHTYGNTLWTIGEWRETNGQGDLCGPGWLHCYDSAELAAFLNPAHADIEDPRLWEIEVGGKTRDDHGLKRGYTRMRLVREVPLLVISTEQRVEIAIRCAMLVTKDKRWTSWAANWLSGANRSEASAWAAALAARSSLFGATRTTASRAAWAAWAAAARAAADAAELNVNVNDIILDVLAKRG